MDQANRPTNEPGRRFIPGRVRPRAVSDLHRNGPIPKTESKYVKPDKQPQKQVYGKVDVVSKPPAKSRSFSKAKPALPRLHRSLVLKRHIVERADQHKKQVRREHKRHFASLIVGFVVIVALAITSWAFWDFLPVVRSISLPFIGHRQQGTTPTLPIKQGSRLDESKPTLGEIQVYQAAADAPRLLKIPKLDVEARVKRVGTSLTGEPISPSNIFDAGWYDDSDKPGQAGTMLVVGHVSGATKSGIFHDLGSLQQNDLVLIERGDKSVVTYIVNKVQTYTDDQIDMSTALQSITADKNGLNLLTSTANYDGGSSKTEQRIIVYCIQQ